MNKNFDYKKHLENEINELKYRLHIYQKENQKLKIEIKFLKRQEFRNNVAIKIKKDRIRKEKCNNVSNYFKKNQTILEKQKSICSENFHTEKKLPYSDISSTETKKNFNNYRDFNYLKEPNFDQDFHSNNIYYIKKETNCLKAIEIKPFDFSKELNCLKKTKEEEELENISKKLLLKKLKIIQKKPKKIFLLKLKKSRKVS